MTFHVEHAGVWKEPDPSAKQGGVWKPVNEIYVRDGGVWKQAYRRVIQVTQTSDTTNLVLKTSAEALGEDLTVPQKIELVIANNVLVRGTGTSAPAIDLRGFVAGSTVTVINHGFILGAPGAGGRGCTGTSTALTGTFPGEQGGPAIIAGPASDGVTYRIENWNIIGGGGGGGGGGSYSRGIHYRTSSSWIAAAVGGGGGGAAQTIDPRTGSVLQTATTGALGNGVVFTAQSPGGGSTTIDQVVQPTAGNGQNPGTGGTYRLRHASNSSTNISLTSTGGGQPGSLGNPGTAGGTGTATVSSGASGTGALASPGGAGGAAGFYAVNNSNINWLRVGDRRGNAG